MLVNNQSIALVGDIATCPCGSKSCSGQGPIVATSPRNASVNGVPYAKAGDLVDTGCGSCFLSPSPHKVSLGTNTGSPLNVGTNVQFGDNVIINMGSGPGAMATSAFNSTPIAKNNIPKISFKNMYWPAYDFLAKEGERELKIEIVSETISIAVLSFGEAQELYDNLGGKNIVSDTKSYGGLTKGTVDAYTLAKELGGLGVVSYTKTINGKDWIIIKNYKKIAKTLELGHMWRANNPRIVKMGLGINDIKGAVRYIKFNVMFEIAFAIGINAADFILRDEATLAEFVGNSSADLVKGFITLAGATALVTTLPLTLGVVGTGMLFTFFSFSISKVLDQIDQQKKFSSKIIEAVERLFK